MLNYNYYSTTGMCIVIITKVGASVSIVCLTFVAQNILKLPERRAKITNRAILDLSISDILISTITHFFGTWIFPQGLAHGFYSNQVTCTSQGFLTIFSDVTGAYYNVTLALTYLLQVRNWWSEDKFRRYHILLILIHIFIGIVQSISPMPHNAYNYMGGWDYLFSGSPLVYNAKDSRVECIRRANTKHIEISTTIPLLLGKIVIISFMVLLF